MLTHTIELHGEKSKQTSKAIHQFPRPKSQAILLTKSEEWHSASHTLRQEFPAMKENCIQFIHSNPMKMQGWQTNGAVRQEHGMAWTQLEKYGGNESAQQWRRRESAVEGASNNDQKPNSKKCTGSKRKSTQRRGRKTAKWKWKQEAGKWTSESDGKANTQGPGSTESALGGRRSIKARERESYD